jgi:anthranilate phosphoribosyltransferase
MTGDATPAQIGGFLVGLRMKGETIDEIAAAAQVMRDLSSKVDISVPHLVDTCGTGGDASGTFNISTASAFVAAAAGANVAKHGNRSVSSKSGSADLLETAGAKLDLSPVQVGQCITESGVGFMFAPLHHGAMKHAIGPRRELGVRTIFNVLGPLTNPANASNQLLGVFSKTIVEPIARVLQQLGSEHVLVVHGDDGMDEISISAGSTVAELKNGEVSVYRVDPGQFGLAVSANNESLKVESAEQSLTIILNVFANEPSPARDIIVLNAGVAIYAAGVSETMQDGVKLASEAIASGEAQNKLDKFVSVSNEV